MQGISVLIKIGLNKDSIEFEKIKKANVFILAGPNEPLAKS